MLANVKQDGISIVSDATQPAVVISPIEPMSAPAYVPPTEAVIPPNPIVAPAPDYQFRGEGGTPFGVRPPLYITPLVVTNPDERYNLDVSGYGDNVPTERLAKPAIARPFILPQRPGEDQIMPVPTGQQPMKPPVAPAVESVTKPGPIGGTIGGFDLSRIPFWAWLAGAALLGSRLLR